MTDEERKEIRQIVYDVIKEYEEWKKRQDEDDDEDDRDYDEESIKPD